MLERMWSGRNALSLLAEMQSGPVAVKTVERFPTQLSTLLPCDLGLMSLGFTQMG